MNIIIADHSARMRSHLRNFLEELPGIVIVGEAVNSEEALTLIQDLTPDVAILDFQLSGSSGLTMIRQVKRMSGPPIIIILSNFSDPEYRSACFQEGVDYFFDKSLEFEKIQETVKTLSQ